MFNLNFSVVPEFQLIEIISPVITNQFVGIKPVPNGRPAITFINGYALYWAAVRGGQNLGPDRVYCSTPLAFLNSNGPVPY